MLSSPSLTRGLAALLLALGLYLAIENTVISADVFQHSSGASVITAFAVAVIATGLELTFASWIRQEKTASALIGELKRNPHQSAPRLFICGLGLALVYHFDLLTTAKHPSFATSDSYFFTILVMALVFGPEVCIVIASWLWLAARDVENRQLDKHTTKDAENRRLKTKRTKLIAIADEVGESEAIKAARLRWGDMQENERL
jgi:hypothetical protein